MYSIGNKFAREFRMYQHGSGGPGFAVVKLAHSVKQMRRVRNAQFRPVHKLLVGGVRMAGLQQNTAFFAEFYQQFYAVQFRCDGHVGNVALRRLIQTLQRGDVYQGNVLRFHYPGFFGGDKRPFQMIAQNMRALFFAKRSHGVLNAPQHICRLAAVQRGAEGRHAVFCQRFGHVQQGFFRSQLRPETRKAVNMHVYQARGGVSAFGVKNFHAFFQRLQTLAREYDGNFSVLDFNAVVRQYFFRRYDAGVDNQLVFHGFPQGYKVKMTSSSGC